MVAKFAKGWEGFEDPGFHASLEMGVVSGKIDILIRPTLSHPFGVLGHPSAYADLAMKAFRDSSTRHSLLESLVRGDSTTESWPLFVEKYSNILHEWSLRWGASEHEAEDVVQETLLTIYRKLQLYRKQDGVPFRSWLRKVHYHCWLSILRSRDRIDRLDPSEFPMLITIRRLSQPDARADLMRDFDCLATEEIIEFARLRVQNRVEPATWQCFELCGLSNHSTQDAACSLRMTQSAVIKAVSRVRRMLREEIEQLDPQTN